ncbi:hypothetical protein HYU50_04615 [Candidatus Woesearchaeota archaeon]|nr:hypothetical protein [Candidatus Woesearchaeota archaeon]
MPKKEAEAEESKTHKWYPILLVLIILAVFIAIISNGLSSLTGGAVRSSNPKPDLVFYDIKYLDMWFSYGTYSNYADPDSLRVSTWILNSGTAKAGRYIAEMSVPDYMNVRYEMPSLNAGEGSGIGAFLGQIPNGRYKIAFTVDVTSKVRESNENNNYLEGYFTVNCTYYPLTTGFPFYRLDNYSDPTVTKPYCCLTREWLAPQLQTWCW